MEDKELAGRLKDAIPGNPDLISERVVTEATQATGRKGPLFAPARRFALAGGGLASFAALALVVSMAMPQEPLIRMATGGNASPMAASDARVEASDKMMWIGPTNYEYITDGLSDQGGRGKIYELRLDGSPEELLAKVGSYFGLAGEVSKEEWSSDQYPSYFVGKEGQRASVQWYGTGNWNYSFWDEKSYVCENKTVTDDQGNSYEVCEQILTPELVPSEQAMRKQAGEIFNALGLTITESDIRVSRSEWGGNAAASLRVDGQETALEWGVNWDSSGRLNFAYGHFATVVDRGEFDTVSPLEAVSRIKDGRWYGSPASANYSMVGASARGYAVDSIAVEPAPAETSAPAEDGKATIMPVMPDQEPVTISLTIKAAEKAPLLIFDQSGKGWLVPGYLLKNDQGWFDSIVSVKEGIIELPKLEERVGIMPLPAPEN
jgi:hypothetical protein